MARNEINTQCGGQSETNLSHLYGIKNLESCIFPDATVEKRKMVADHYGHEPQSRMLQEEAAELIQAVKKYYRSKNALGLKSGEAADNMIEEMADVLIMIIQELMFLKTDPELFLDLVDMKLDRQIKRMEDEA